MTLGRTIQQLLEKGSMTFKQIHEQVGGDDMKLRRSVQNLRYNGKVKVADDDDMTITLTSRRAPPQPRRSKPAGKAATMKRPYKSIANKLARARHATNGADLRTLTADNLLAAGALLRQAIEDGVEGLDQNFAIKNALDNQHRAEQIWRAAQS